VTTCDPLRLPQMAAAPPLRAALPFCGLSCAELLLALSEGCVNAVQHATGADGYEVRAVLDEECCVVDIADNGRSAVRLPVSPSMPDVIEERGRGMSIMAVSTDSLQISPRRPHGLAVRFTKRLC